MQPDWDDLRIVLGVARGGTTRGASELLRIGHSTVARRVDALEERWGVRVFDRLPTGFVLTQDGEHLVARAEKIESEVNAAQLLLTGREKGLEGLIRITTLETIATHFLLPVMADFAGTYPGIEFELSVGYQSLDLRKREADIAIRATDHPPEHLIGQKLGSQGWAGYATPEYIESHDLGDPEDARWIGFGTRSRAPSWIARTSHPHLPAWGLFDDIPLQAEAARQHLGIAHIPCHVGDIDPDLVRVPLSAVTNAGDIWILRHKDTRSTERLRVFTRFVTEAFEIAKPVFSGQGA